MFHQNKPKTFSTLRMNVNILIIAQLKYFLWRINLIIFIIDAIHSTPLNLYYNTGMALWPLRSFSFDSKQSMRKENLFGYILHIRNSKLFGSS